MKRVNFNTVNWKEGIDNFQTIEKISTEICDEISVPNYFEKESPKAAELSGVIPFKRGPYASMYLSKPWTIRQYA